MTSLIEPAALVVLTPHQPEAEAAVLGSILVDPQGLSEVKVMLRPEHFYMERHGWIYRAMLDLLDRGVDVDTLTIAGELESKGKGEEAGGVAYLLSLISATPSTLNLLSYARMVHDAWMRRRLLDIASLCAKLAHSAERPVDELLAEAEKGLRGVIEERASTTVHTVSAADLASDEQRQADDWAADPQEVRGLKCGLPDADRAMGGWEPQRLYGIGAPPGVGKSTLLGQMAAGFAAQDIPVLFFAMEMPPQEMLRRIAAARARVPLNDIRRGKAPTAGLDGYKAALAELSTMPLHFEPGRKSLREIEWTVRREAGKHGIQVVMIDTFNKVKDTDQKGSRYEGVTTTSGFLANFALASPQELGRGIVLIAAVQLSRAHGLRGDKRPILTDFRDSGAVEADLDGAAMLYREAYYFPEKIAQAKDTEFIVRKNRYGECNHLCPLLFEAVYPGFYPVAKPVTTTATVRPVQAKKPALAPAPTQAAMSAPVDVK